jgi:hypothetical protein
VELTHLETLVLTVVGYFQPVTRASIAEVLGRPISRDVIAVTAARVSRVTGCDAAKITASIRIMYFPPPQCGWQVGQRAIKIDLWFGAVMV